MRTIIITISCAVLMCVLTGCATSGSSGGQVSIAEQLRVSNKRVAELETKEAQLKKMVEYLVGVRKTLEKEKRTYVEANTQVRQSVRKFLKLQMGMLRDFSGRAEFTDYIGGELMDRKNQKGKDLLLVDLQNRIPSDTTITGIKVYAKGAMEFRLCLLREEEQGLKVVLLSEVFEVVRQGVNSVTLPFPQSAKEGDLIGLYCPLKVEVPYGTGTGNTRTVSGPVMNGQVIKQKSLEGRDRRTYSFGIVGLVGE